MISEEKILYNLEKIGFNKKESEVYLELVKSPSSNGSKIAKSLGYPRTSVYQALSTLQNKGYIHAFLEGEITCYIAVEPREIFEKYKKEVKEATILLEEEFNKIEVNSGGKQFYNLNSVEEIKQRIKQMLKKATKIVYINTNMDLAEFSQEFKLLNKNNVRVILFSFLKRDYDGMNIETYFRDSFNIMTTEVTKRIMMVVDSERALMASNYEGEFYGTYSENKLLSNIITEHIRNDIHIMKLEEKYGKEINKVIALDF